MSERQFRDNERWDDAEQCIAKHKDMDAQWNLLNQNENEANNHKINPERECEVLDWLGVILWHVHSWLNIEAPSTTEALEDTTKEEQVGAQVVVDHIE